MYNNHRLKICKTFAVHWLQSESWLQQYWLCRAGGRAVAPLAPRRNFERKMAELYANWLNRKINWSTSEKASDFFASMHFSMK